MSIQLLQKAVLAYYRGNPIMSDYDYDELYFSTKKQFPKHSFFKKVGTEVTTNKVKLSTRRGSLSKLDPTKAIEWCNKLDYDVIVTPKYDGLSITLEYDKKGNFKRATTRGDGTYGEDVTDRAIHFRGFVQKINPKAGITEVTGEALISKKTFDKKYSNDYAMSRNMTVGKIKPYLTASRYRSKTSKEDFDILSDISFVAYTSNIEHKSKSLRYLKKLGFIPAKILYTGALDLHSLEVILKLRDPAYDCDGVVIDIDTPNVIKKFGFESDGMSPAFAIAVKPTRENQDSAEAIIDYVEWSINKTGNLVPIAKLKNPVKLSGAEISSISLANYKRWKSEGFGDGAKIRIVRSGDVIPYADIIKPAPTKVSARCPYCNGKIIKHGVHIHCPNTSCTGRVLNKLQNFFITMGVEDISVGTIKQLYEAGFDTITKIVALRQSQLVRLDKWGTKKAEKFVSEMQKIKNCNLVDLMHASNCFNDGKTGLGKSILQVVVEELGEKAITGVLAEDLEGLEHFGKGRIALYVKCQPEWIRMYHRQLKNHFNVTVKPKQKKGKLTGKTFCWTGFRDKALKEWIENNGGIMKDSFTKKIDVMFAARTSSKTKKAEAAGIKIVPAGEAKEYISKLLK